MKRKRGMRGIALILAAMLALGMLAGCSGSTNAADEDAGEATVSSAETETLTEDAENEEETSDAEAEEETEEEQSDATSYTVTDMAGVEVTFESVPQTVATFGSIGVLNTLIECLGCGDRICNNMGANFESTESYPNLRLEFAPQTKDAPLLTNSDGELLTEDILTLNPDVCVTMSESTADELRALGLNVIYLAWQDQDDVTTAMTIMGQVLGREEVAQDYLNYFNEMVEKAEELTASIPDDEKKTVDYGSITEYSQPHIIAEWWIVEAGGISVTAEDRGDAESYSYELEDLLKWDPDVLLVSSRDQIDELLTDSIYADLTAVKNEAIYCVPTVGHAWGNRTVEQPLTIFWTINKLYPDLVSDEELGEIIYDFYDQFFDYQLSDDQLAVYVEGK